MKPPLLIAYALILVVTALLVGVADLPGVLLAQSPGAGIAANLLLLVLGMLAITNGGDIFTDSAVAIARATRVPTVIIGATIVSLATTFPEFMVSFTAALRGVPGFAVGNALGSCCCNIGLIVGTCALLKGLLARRRGESPCIPVNRQTLAGPGLFMIAAGVAALGFSLFDNEGLTDVETGDAVPFAIARWQGGMLFALLAAYLWYSLRTALRARYESTMDTSDEQARQDIRSHIVRVAALFVTGGALVFLGARLLVANAEQIAIQLGVPKLVIGLTVLAIGTSLPEYTISLLAVIKGHGSLGMGNIIGANVLNICWVVATCAVVKPLPIQLQTVVMDGPVMLGLMAMMLGLAWRSQRISPTSGAALCAVFVAYYVLIFALFSNT